MSFAFGNGLGTETRVIMMHIADDPYCDVDIYVDLLENVKAF